MKSIWLVLFLIGFTFFQCCAPPVQFTEPQPTGEDNLESFPQKLQGQFLNVADSSVLTIGEKLMVQYYHSLLRESKHDLDSSLFQLINDSTIVNRDTHEQTKISMINDTIIGYIDVYDTVFHISQKNVLRKFKGFYFLNTAILESWEVQMLNLDNRHLTVGVIPSQEGMDKIKTIVANPVDSASGNVHLSQDEFKEFVRQGGFYDSSQFTRIK